MDETQWLTSDDPLAMLDVLTARPTTRKLRLLACAITRMHNRGMTDPDGVRCLETCETYADRWAEGRFMLHSTLTLARKSVDAISGWFWVITCRDEYIGRALRDTLCEQAEFMKHHHGGPGGSYAERAAGAVRCIFGNPFRPVLAGRHDDHIGDERVCEKCGERYLKRSLKCTRCGSDYIRKWRVKDECLWVENPTVQTLALAAYKERDSEGRLEQDRLAILADAVEEAGCPPDRECTVCLQVVKIPTTSTVMSMSGFTISPGSVSRKTYLPGCIHCEGTGRRPNPLLAHLHGRQKEYLKAWGKDYETPPEHWRGCHALDSILCRS